jgi:predicted O-linked N-acetylglucosamine transferase (SPINDLY family)
VKPDATGTELPPPTLQSAELTDALRCLRGGRLGEAEALFAEILRADPNHARAAYYLGIAAARCGAYHRAETAFRRALALTPGDADVHYNLGNILMSLERTPEAVASYRSAIAVAPDAAMAHLALAQALGRQGRTQEASEVYRRALELNPGAADGHNERGVLLAIQGAHEEAEACFERALDIDPEMISAHRNLANLLAKFARRDEPAMLAGVRIQLHRNLAKNPRDINAWYGLGVLAYKSGRHRIAELRFARTVALAPEFSRAHASLGLVAGERGCFDEALAHYERALALGPDDAATHNNFAVLLKEHGRIPEAVAHFQQALVLKPDHAAAHNNLAVLLKNQGRLAEAIAHCKEALAARPDYVDAHYNLGLATGEQGRGADALGHYERALAIDSSFAPARFAMCMGQLPILYRDAAEIGLRREAYKAQLRSLCDCIESHPKPAELASAVGSSQPFYLAYQGGSDRDLQSQYGLAMCRIMSARYPPAQLPPPPTGGEPVKLGIVSGFFHHHSNWKIPIRGWLRRLDRRAFRIFGYYTGTIVDGATREAASLCERFVRGPLPLDRWRQTILSDAPHVLIYPEIGMHQVSAQLAAQRLARAQCNSWGHPDTSGFPTVDYFLSSALMEPADGQDHYTEQLVRLPNLSTSYEPLEIPTVPLRRAELGLRETSVAYWCGHTIKKYLPQFDQLFPRIAREVVDCQFVFVSYGQDAVDELFRRRLDAAFAGFGLRARDYCVMLAPVEMPRYVAAVGRCDIVLDCIGWSGCNSSLESLAHDLPIVTCPGPLMRSRHSMAILTMMGSTETVAADSETYIATAVRLAHDLSWRDAVKRQMALNKHRVYRDEAGVSGLADFLDYVAHHHA